VPVDVNAAANTVAENAGIGTAVGITAFASDADATTNTVTYSLDDNAGGRFMIDANTGVVTVAGVLDFATASSHNVTVRATSADGSFGTQTFSISVTSVSLAPTLVNNVWAVTEGGRLTVDSSMLSATDPDQASGLLTFVVSNLTGGQFESVANPGVAITSFAQAEVMSGQIVFVHDGGEFAPSFSVRVSDGTLGDGPHPAAIQFTAVNDAPNLQAGSGLTTLEDTPLVFSASRGNAVTVSDADASAQPVILRLSATHGTVTLGTTSGLTFAVGDGVDDSQMVLAGTIAELNAALEGMTFTPTADFNGQATMDLTVDDQGNLGVGGSRTDLEQLMITVLPVADVPVAVDDVFSVSEGGSLQTAGVTLLSNDRDGDGDTLTVTLVDGPQHGTLLLNPDGSFRYTHDGSETLRDTFTYRVTDTTGLSATGQATLSIQPVNDAPVAGNDAFVMSAGTVLVNGSGVAANDTDVEDTTLAITVLTTPQHGTLSLQADGSFSYTPTPGFVGVDRFTYWAADSGRAGAIGTVTIQVTAISPPTDSSDPGLPTLTDSPTEDTDSGPEATAGNDPTEELIPVPTVPATVPVTVLVTDAGSPIEDVESPAVLPATTQELAELTTDALRDLRVVGSDRVIPYYQLVGDRRDYQVSESLATTNSTGTEVITPMVATAERFFKELDRLADQFADVQYKSLGAVAVTATATAASAAYIAWTLRTGYLAAGMLASLPAWVRLDPLPILDFVRAQDGKNRKDTATNLLAALRDEL
jgi:VCBS repeat-containing protein